MPTAWHHLRVPSAPAAFQLRADETQGPPKQRFLRRTILAWDCPTPSPGAQNQDQLALIDKALPHAHLDLMLSEASATPKPTAAAVLPVTGRLLWRSALEFVRFVSQPGPRQAFQLDGGRLMLALNCDPYTTDRESVQAAKQFHLHLLYWSARELEAIAAPLPLSATTDPRKRRQLVDPLSFLAGPLIASALEDIDFAAIGGRLLRMDDQAVVRGERPPGCLIELPDWKVLGEPTFEPLMRSIHQRLARLSAGICQAVVGQDEPPAPWHRHRLRPAHQRHTALQALGLPEPVAASLDTLTSNLRNLSPATAARLQRASPATRKHCMSLNQPCYGINLYAPQANTAETPVMAGSPVYLLLSAKLFSGIGCAGLLPIGQVPSVRVIRGAGTFSAEDWQARAAWQHAFAEHLRQSLADQPGLHIDPPKRLRNLTSGWC
ncbi:hypothetical protein [Thiorhodovibrio frisius]|uniref:Uncharacterized protein n=1 Tax=Thiorhodovibrio frisius TaxID=631362 RepID=H8YZB0_9GAMM|nr:hypothetical protein [Thiorhodovibrio frisius]EIC22037.1 hypothetical protein Thi970DRAFT_02278 [Thiorhodovibrio frisius]WPL24328.1 hypothetical protein Thiofri_04545 [Thiorhodovibrio frisius]